MENMTGDKPYKYEKIYSVLVVVKQTVLNISYNKFLWIHQEVPTMVYA